MDSGNLEETIMSEEKILASLTAEQSQPRAGISVIKREIQGC